MRELFQSVDWPGPYAINSSSHVNVAIDDYDYVEREFPLIFPKGVIRRTVEPGAKIVVDVPWALGFPIHEISHLLDFYLRDEKRCFKILTCGAHLGFRDDTRPCTISTGFAEVRVYARQRLLSYYLHNTKGYEILLLDHWTPPRIALMCFCTFSGLRKCDPKYHAYKDRALEVFHKIYDNEDPKELLDIWLEVIAPEIKRLNDEFLDSTNSLT